MKFINLESFFYRFAQIRRYTPQKIKITKIKNDVPHTNKNAQPTNHKIHILDDLLRFDPTDR